MPEYMTVNEVASLLRMSPRQVQYLAKANEFEYVKPFRKVLIFKSSVAKKLGIKQEEL